MTEYIGVWRDCARSVCEGVARLCDTAVPLTAVRVPARGAELGVRLPPPAALKEEAACAALSAFTPVCGVSPVSACRMRDDFLLFTVSLPLLDAAMAEACAALPPAREDCASLALNRMLLLARKGPAPCPDAPGVRRALWLSLGLCTGPQDGAPPRFASLPHRLRAAEEALLTMLSDTPPRLRPALAAQCGSVAEAAARLLYRAYTERM